ncbi:hypothetical protein R3F64_01265 [Halomonas sp. 5021]
MPARINKPRTKQAKRRLASSDFYRRQQQARIREQARQQEPES